MNRGVYLYDMSDLDEDYLKEKLLDRPIANIRDLQYTYGVIAMAASDLDHPYAKYLTPSENRFIIDKEIENSVIAIQVDFTGNKPSYEGIRVVNYSEDLIGKVAHSKSDNASVADFSITHRVGKDPKNKKIRKYAFKRLDRWPNDDKIKSVVENHTDGYLIEGLAEIGSKENIKERLLEDIQSELPEDRSSDYQPLVTVQVDRGDGYEWPGEINVFNEAMASRRKLEASDKGSFSNNAIGKAVDFVSGEEGDVIGVSESPLNHYKTKQQSTFQGLDAEESSWLNHPITFETSLLISKGHRFIKYSYQNVFQHRVYFLPYITGVIGVEEATEIYEVLTEAEEEVDDGNEISGNAASKYTSYISVERDIREGEGEFAYYVVMLEYEQNILFNFRAEMPYVPHIWFENIAEDHEELVKYTKLLHGGDEAGYFRDWEDESDTSKELYDFTNRDATTRSSLLKCIASGLYTTVSLPSPEEYTEGDYRAQIYQNILEKNPINAERLLQKQVEYLISEEGEYFPDKAIVHQWIRLIVLRSNNLIDSCDDSLESKGSLPERDNLLPVMDETDNNTDGSYYEAVEDSLREFVESSPSLSDNDERKAVFAVGVLVGSLSNYQARERGLSQRLIDKHPISRMGEKRLQEAFTSAVDIATTYGGAENRNIDMVQPTYVEYAQDALRNVSIGDLSLSNADVKYHYSLGVSYGMNVYVDYNNNQN